MFFFWQLTNEDAKAFIQKCLSGEISGIWAIEYKAKYVGNISLMKCTDVYRKSAEIGYFIGEPYWNKGIGSQAIDMICNFGFEQMDIVRIHCGVFEYNTASCHVLEKCGFKKEGVFEKAIFKMGRIWNEIRYAKTKKTLA